ncbi:MAG TPA: RpiB/LacA/LacB family sugar-phosphate isomerase [Thermoanaerobaculia bacterium]
MRIAVAADHAGFPLKQGTIDLVRALGYSAEDLGTDSTDPVDYPDFARAVAVAVASGRCDRGIVICGSGVGASVAATKVPGIRAAMCHDTFSARQGVEDDDMNVISLGARVIGPALAAEIVKAFANARFSEAERHVRRLRKVNAIEEEARNGVFDEARRLR